MGSAPGGSSAHLPQLRLDDLLDELQARLDTARSTRDRVHSLLEAVLAVGRDLELTQVLRHIVESAVALVDAEYGALGVIGEDQRLSQFIPVGVTDDQIENVGPLPSGHGLLGELIRHLDITVPPKVADEVIAVLQEALSNVARHSRAGSVTVTLAAGADLVLTVTDDGVGLPEGGRRNGLANLAERAAALGGAFDAHALPQGGTRLVWRVPLPAA